MSEKCSYVFKILLIGDSGVGKSSLLTRYAENAFEDTYRSTIGVNYRVRTITVEEKMTKLQMWDTAGQERFRAVTACCFRGADGVMLVYDTTNESSFHHIPYWLEQVQKNAPEGVKKLLVGNKCDLGMLRAVDAIKAKVEVERRVQEFATEHGMDFIEASAKGNVNVDQAFLNMATSIKRAADARSEKSGAGSRAASIFRIGSTQPNRATTDRTGCMGRKGQGCCWG